MFKQAQTEKFWQIVKVEFAKEEGGRGAVEFDVQFKRLSPDTMRDLIAESERLPDGDLHFMRQIVTDWKRVPGDDGSPVAFSEEALKQLYDLGFGGAVVLACMRSFPKAREKN